MGRLKAHFVSISGMPETGKIDEWVNDWNDGCMVAQKAPYEENVGFKPFMRESRVPIYGYHDIRKLWEMAVRRACEGFDSKKPIVLYGAGLIGGTVLDILGKDQVKFFIDNSSDKIGKKYRGVMVKPFDEYLKVNEQYNCLITASYKVSLEMKQELQMAGAECRMLYDDLPETEGTGAAIDGTF